MLCSVVFSIAGQLVKLLLTVLPLIYVCFTNVERERDSRYFSFS